MVAPARRMFGSLTTEAAQEGADLEDHQFMNHLLEAPVLVHHAVVRLFHDPGAALGHDEDHQQHAPGHNKVW